MRKSNPFLVVLLVVVLVWTLLPFLYLLLASLTAGSFLPRGLALPSEVTLDNYRNALFTESIGPQLLNSLLVAGVTTVIVLVFSIPAAYGFARLKARTAGFVFYLLLVVRMIPDITFTVPTYFFVKDLGLLGSRFSLCLIYAFWQVPFSIWLLRPFFELIPYELEEAALLDGASQLGVLRRVIFHLLGPVLAVVFIFTFQACYIEYLFASLLTSIDTMTLPVRLAQYSSMHKLYWGPMSAAVTISLIPMIFIYVFGQKYIVRGLTLGAIK